MHTCSENSIYLQYRYINWHFVTLNPGCANQATTVIACIDCFTHVSRSSLSILHGWSAVLAPRSDRKRVCVTIQIWPAICLIVRGPNHGPNSGKIGSRKALDSMTAILIWEAAPPFRALASHNHETVKSLGWRNSREELPRPLTPRSSSMASHAAPCPAVPSHETVKSLPLPPVGCSSFQEL